MGRLRITDARQSHVKEFYVQPDVWPHSLGRQMEKSKDEHHVCI